MLIYDRFVFLHMPKTGGNFIEQLLREEHGPPAGVRERHAGWEAIPPEASGRPGLVYVRNPWDWYVSWYHYLADVGLLGSSETDIARNPFVRLLLGENITLTTNAIRGLPSFSTVVRNACSNMTPGHPVMAEMIERGDPHLRLIGEGKDFYSARFAYLTGNGLDTELLTIGRFETLIDDLWRFLDEQGTPLSHDALERARRKMPVNAGARGPYRDYYDDDLRDLVGRSCSDLVDRFGYSF